MERLWILGDRLLAVAFTNHVMLELLGIFQGKFYSAWETEFVFANTVPGSKLRLLFHDLIAMEGPLSKKRLSHKKFDEKAERQTWRNLLVKGGDIINDCIEVGFSTFVDDKDEKPWDYKNYSPYTQDSPYIEAGEWLDEKDNVLDEIVRPPS
jgi:hypothetical protein